MVQEYVILCSMLDAAGNLIAGYKIAKKWDINARYSHGILNILKDKSVYGNGSDNVTTKNRFSIYHYYVLFGEKAIYNFRLLV